MKTKKTERDPKILIFDLETSPILGYTWKMWDTNVIKVVKDWHLICFAYKWLGEKDTHFVANWHYSRDLRNDKKSTKELHRVLDEADIVIGHNIARFDNKKSNAKFLEHGLTPPSPYKNIDTLQICRQNFANTSNKLDSVAKLLQIEGKLQHEGFLTMYENLLQRDKKTQKTMEKYNIQDVVLNEEVYIKLRPWMKNHPVLSVYSGDSCSCPKCGGHDYQKRGFSYTGASKYQRYKCNSCGGWFQDRKQEKINKPKFK